MKTKYCLYKGAKPASGQFVKWIEGWWLLVEGLAVEKGALPGGINWLLIGNFYSDDPVDNIVNKSFCQGGDTLFRSDGQFVLIIHNLKRGEVNIFRDRTGLLPLNYYKDKKGNIAISLWQSDLINFIDKIPSPAIVEQWPLFRGIVPPDSLFQGVKVLSGRFFLKIVDGNISQHEAAKTVSEVRLYRSIKDASQDLGRFFNKAVQKRVNSTMRIGATLSGGNDSSLLVAVLRSIYPGHLKTMFVTFEGYERNYSSDAYMVARKCNTDHIEMVLSAKDFFNLWAETVFACQSPINHPCTIGQNAAFKRLAQEVDVVFSGKGADTVFGGPFWAPLLFLAKNGRVLSKSIRNKIGSLASRLKSELLPIKLVSKSLEALGTPLREYIFSEVTFGDRKEVARVFRSDAWQKTIDVCQKFIKEDPLADLFFFDVLDWHPVTYDAEKRLCFFYGLKPMYPFLDYDLMRNSLRLPIHLRYHLFAKKAALKKYSQNFFDKKFIYKPKEGFGVPLGKWFSGNTFTSFLNLPLEERSLRRGWWNENELKQIIKYHQSGKGTDHSAEGIPWIVINLELWARICIEGDSPQLYQVG